MPDAKSDSAPTEPTELSREPLAPRVNPLVRQLIWAAPLVLSLLFAAGLLTWALRSDRDKRDELRQALISDALSLDAQLRARLADEQSHLADLARALPAHAAKPVEVLERRPELAAGIARGWLSVTWLDERNRIVAHLPADAKPGKRTRAKTEFDEPSDGLTMHVVAPVANGETLVARYSPLVLLQRGVPWWLGTRYVVQMVDGLDQVIATTGDGGKPPLGDSYRISFGDTLPDVYLLLTQREALPQWLRPLPAVTMLGFLLLIAAASLLLRKQVKNVASAEAQWRREVRWRGAMEDSALVGLRARDGDGRLLYVNRTFCDMVGYSRDELINCGPSMPYWPKDALEETSGRLRRTLAGNAPRAGYEARWRHRDGHAVDAMVFESPLIGADGVQIGWMGSVVDITERKQLEERERRQAETMVHHARLTMLGEVASTLAHELNQPLMAISSYATGIGNSLARQKYAEPVVLGALQRLGEQAHYAGRIVQRIRGFLTRREPQVESCDLNLVIRAAVGLLQKELERHGVEVVLQLDPSLPRILADPVLIEQVVINLVRNAGDARSGCTGPGKIRVASTVAALPGHVERFVRVDVEDNGPGIGERNVEELCAAFYSTRREGMGMGLAICRSIVEVHQGALDAINQPGGGARFSFTLPIVPAASAHSSDALRTADERPEVTSGVPALVTLTTDSSASRPAREPA
jgi:two-component system sensor histidine kinase DctS